MNRDEQPLRELVLEMHRRGIIKFGEFTLTSGKKSPYYLDLRLLPSYPRLYKRVMTMAYSILEKLDFDVVVGVATAGIIHASYLGCIMEKPIAYVRKKPKEHGTRRLIEGRVEGLKALIVDDVATTGGSLERAVNAVRQEGGIVEYAFVIVDRREGARERLEKQGVKLYSLLDAQKIIEILYEEKAIDEQTFSRVKQYIEKEKSSF